MGGNSNSNSETRVIEVGEERELEHVETTDYFFEKIGESVPLTLNGSCFDLQNPPSLPLAASERFHLIFVAHPSDGFCVAKTVDVINLAKDIKDGRAGPSTSSVLDISIVRVPLGKVSVLSLSTDSSNLAASVGGDIYFFSVKSLLAKEKGHLSLLSIESPKCVKDICWTKGRETSFLVLSNAGTLYSGDIQGDLQQQQPLKHVMDNVDAVELSTKGNFLAVARKQILSILTPEFNEKQQILLQFKLGFVDSNAGCAVRVDSIQWVRPDCILLGCLQQTAVGKEENYFVQVIMCKNGEEVTDASSNPVILSLNDLFLSIVDDMMPLGHGSHLLMSYLETRQIAVLANRKNTDQHIELVGWLSDSDEPAVIHIERDNWLPRIELQENGDDNVLLGLCIDRNDIYESIRVKIGEEDQRELSPDCIILCLTHEGKLVLFYFASTAGDSPASHVPSDKEEISAIRTPDLPTISMELKDDKVKQAVLDIESCDTANVIDKDYFEKDKGTFDMWVSKAKHELEPGSSTDVDKDLGSGQSGPAGKEWLNQTPPKSFAPDASNIDVQDSSKAEKPLLVGSRPVSYYPLGKNLDISSKIFHGEKSRNSMELGRGESRSSQHAVFKGVEQGTTNLSGSFNSSSIKAINAGQSTSVSNSMTSGVHNIQGCFAPGKAVNHVVHPINVNPKSPSQTMHPIFEATLSKKYGNMKDMMSELDKLLECIEEPGGFMDTCTSPQKSLLENLEEAMKVLCCRCTTWQSLLDERAASVQHLLDNTVQVLARKIYMESMVKQTRDKQYWDLWNRQKLCSELEIKRRSIMNLSQDLINQLIELEKHFNSLELNDYGESNGNLGYQSLRSKYVPSRRIQSLHAVHNALNSQLAAAEQLSDYLSRQIAVLSIKSPSVKPGNVKDQLFKMIGISCESRSEVSLHTRKGIDAQNVTPSFSSAVTAIGNDFRSNQSGTSNHEPETARRRRDSFDQNWANFEPSKTTIKRMLGGNEHSDVQRSSHLMDKRFSSSSNAEGSVAFSGGHAAQFNLSNDARNFEDGPKNFAPGSLSGSLFLEAKDLHDPTSIVDCVSGKQIVDTRNLGAFSPDFSSSSGSVCLHVKKEKHQITAGSPDHEKTRTGNLESVLVKSRKSGFSVAQSSQAQPNFEGAQPHLFPFSKTANDMPKVSRSSSSLSGSCHETESSLVLSHSDGTATLIQLAIPTNGAQISEVSATSSTTVTTSVSSSAMDPPSNSLSSSTPRNQVFSPTLAIGSFSGTTDNQDNFRPALQPSRLACSSASSQAALSSFSSKSAEKAAASSMPSSTNSRVKPRNLEHQSCGDKAHAGSALPAASSFTPVDAFSSKSHEISASSSMAFSVSSTLKTPNTAHQSPASEVSAGTPQKVLSTSELSWNFSSSTESSKVASTALDSTSHLSLSNSATHGLDMISNSQAEKSTGAFLLPQAHVSKFEDRIADAVVAQEDEMEEEAPETNHTADLSLGSLSGLGLSSGLSATAFRPNPNPFGGPTVSTAVTAMSSSQNVAIPSGQLFRPASFSFQSLQPSQQSQPENGSAFNFAPTAHAPSSGSPGQPAQIGVGQQALGSVLGSFGQSRQFGAALQGNSFGGGGIASGQSGGGFLNTASSNGFSGISASSGGFAAGSATDGFAGVSATGGGGFAGIGATTGGFAAVAVSGGGFAGSAGGGGGFGAFANQGGSGGGFSSFVGGLASRQPPSERFTQMRK